MDSEPERRVRIRRRAKEVVYAYERNVIVVVVRVGVSVSRLSVRLAEYTNVRSTSSTTSHRGHEEKEGDLICNVGHCKNDT